MFSGCINRMRTLEIIPNQQIHVPSFEDVDINEDGNITAEEFSLIEKGNPSDFLSPIIVFASISLVILILLYFSRRSM
jgi:hypothetical protein